MKLKYTGPADVRKITKSDFKGVDVDHDAIEASEKNDFTVEVDDACAAYLLGKESATWVEVKPEAK